MNLPAETRRQIRGTDKTYEVLAELTAMWWQAVEAGVKLVEEHTPGEGELTYQIELGTMTAKIKTWQDAIAIYAGFTERELGEWLDDFRAERRTEVANAR